jgi:hypothetical protein
MVEVLVKGRGETDIWEACKIGFWRFDDHCPVHSEMCSCCYIIYLTASIEQYYEHLKSRWHIERLVAKLGEHNERLKKEVNYYIRRSLKLLKKYEVWDNLPF